jgi:cytochrome c peroxidase
VAACLLLSACGKEERVFLPTGPDVIRPSTGPIAPIEPPSKLDPQRVSLGASLFTDVRLSANGRMSCASCHDLSHAGADAVPHSIGVRGAALALNTPTVFNSALNFRQFWDGRASNLEEQIEGPLLNPAEMGSTWEKVLKLLREDGKLAARFEQSYGERPSRASVTDAIATFERSLSTPDAPFDRYIAGDKQALSASAAHGYELFTGYGCSSCHQGQGVGGNMFQKLGVMADYFAARGNETEADLGRYNITHQEADRHVFKVPSLRNVARTAPYFHDGSVARLDEAVRVMARFQLGRDLEAADVNDLAAFLESLTGVYQGRSL